jgi:hypothetical protein
VRRSDDRQTNCRLHGDVDMKRQRRCFQLIVIKHGGMLGWCQNEIREINYRNTTFEEIEVVAHRLLNLYAQQYGFGQIGYTVNVSDDHDDLVIQYIHCRRIYA